MVAEQATPDPLQAEYAPPLAEMLRILWRRLWVVVLVTILAAGAAIGFGLVQTPEYESSIMILVGQERRADTPDNLGSDVQGLQQITQTMTRAVNTRPVAEAVISDLDLDVTPEEFLEDRLTVEQAGATQFIEVSYRDTSPERAQAVADAVGEVFSGQVSEVSAGANDITALVWEEANPPEDPASPNLLLNVAAGLAAGLALGVGLAFLLEYLDDRWRSSEEVERVSGLPNFGVVPQFEVLEGKALEREKGGKDGFALASERETAG